MMGRHKAAGLRKRGGGRGVRRVLATAARRRPRPGMRVEERTCIARHAQNLVKVALGAHHQAQAQLLPLLLLLLLLPLLLLGRGAQAAATVRRHRAQRAASAPPANTGREQARGVGSRSGERLRGRRWWVGNSGRRRAAVAPAARA